MVCIFRHAISVFRSLLKTITDGYDVLTDSLTLATIAMNLFKKKFLKTKMLAIIPENGQFINAHYL